MKSTELLVFIDYSIDEDHNVTFEIQHFMKTITCHFSSSVCVTIAK